MNDPLLFLTLVILCGIFGLGAAAAALLQIMERKISTFLMCSSIMFGGFSVAIYRGMKTDFSFLRDDDIQSTMGLILFFAICAVFAFMWGGKVK